MSNTPSELKYTKTHEWVKIADDGTAVIGITDHAQCLLGDIVFVEPPELNIEVSAGEEAGVIESVKSASDIYAPIAGEIIAFNTALSDTPDLINQDPYGDGWVMKIMPRDEDQLKDLLDNEEYADLTQE